MLGPGGVVSKISLRNQSHELTYPALGSSRDLAFVVTSSENRPAVQLRRLGTIQSQPEPPDKAPALVQLAAAPKRTN
jgi:hypothetical protein